MFKVGVIYKYQFFPTAAEAYTLEYVVSASQAGYDRVTAIFDQGRIEKFYIFEDPEIFDGDRILTDIFVESATGVSEV